MFKGVRAKVGERLKQNGLELVEDFIKIKDDEEKQAIAIRTIRCLSKRMMNSLLLQLNDIIIGECPPDIDHTRKDHPYKRLWKE